MCVTTYICLHRHVCVCWDVILAAGELARGGGSEESLNLDRWHTARLTGGKGGFQGHGTFYFAARRISLSARASERARTIKEGRERVASVSVSKCVCAAV